VKGRRINQGEFLSLIQLGYEEFLLAFFRQTGATQRVRLCCLLVSILFLIYCGLLATHSVRGFPSSHVTQEHWPWLGDKPVGEDGFYMLSVADDLARTHHMVYTYQMPTTGIQPLSTVLFAGVAWLTNHLGGDRWTLVRAVLFFGSMEFVLFCWIISRFAASLAREEWRSMVFILAFFLALFDFTLFRLFTYGLETGIYLLTIVWCMLVWRKIVSGSVARWTDMAILGVAGGFAGLARIDFGLLYLVLLVFLLGKRIATVAQILVAGAIALLVTSPWFLYVHSVSGAWLPSSGRAESHLIGLNDFSRVVGLVEATLVHLAPWCFAVSAGLIPWMFLLGSLALLGYALWHAPILREGLSKGGTLRTMFLPWIVGIVLLAGVYLTLFWSTHFYSRYLAPITAVSIPLVALALSEQGLVRRRPGMTLALLALCFCIWDVASLHTGKMGNAFLINAGFIHQNFPDARVGAFQSGTVAYFNPNVENLDGKLNQGALEAAQHHRLNEFIDTEKIDVLYDAPGYVHQLPETYLEKEWEPCTAPMPMPGWTCLIRKGSPAT
jgi:hypothetical protein